MVVVTIEEAIECISVNLDQLRPIQGMEIFIETMEAEIVQYQQYPDQQELVYLPALDPICQDLESDTCPPSLEQEPTLCQHQVNSVSTPTLEPDTILTPTLETEQETEGDLELIFETESELVSKDDLVSTQCQHQVELVSTPTQDEDDSYSPKSWGGIGPPWGWYRKDSNILDALRWLETRDLDLLTIPDSRARALGVFGAKLAIKRKAKKAGLIIDEYITQLLEGLDG